MSDYEYTPAEETARLILEAQKSTFKGAVHELRKSLQPFFPMPYSVPDRVYFAILAHVILLIGGLGFGMLLIILERV